MIRVLRPGMFTTVQDLGRVGYLQYGVARSGPMDVFSQTVANVMVGNSQDAATLECTLIGPSLEFVNDAVIAVCGPHTHLSINGASAPMWRPIVVRAGARLEVGEVYGGCRVYVAACGGIDVPIVLSSRSTYLRATIGGVEGRALKAGDVLRLGTDEGETASRRLRDTKSENAVAWPSWALSQRLWQETLTGPVRVMRGTHFDSLTESSQNTLWSEEFPLTPQSDRMGVRLGGSNLELLHPLELISEGVVPGTVQLPPGGHPIVLMADAQTTGGYPRILQIISADLPRVAQLRPGQSIRFTEVTVADAHEVVRQRHELIRMLKWAVAKESLHRHCEGGIAHENGGFEL